MSTEQRFSTGDEWLDAQIRHITERYDAAEAMDTLVTLLEDVTMTHAQMVNAMVAVVTAYAEAGEAL